MSTLLDSESSRTPQQPTTLLCTGVMAGQSSQNYGAMLAEGRNSSSLLEADISAEYSEIPATTTDDDHPLLFSSLRTSSPLMRSHRSSANLIEAHAEGSRIGTATIVSSTISMTKNLVGAGVLSLSGGMAIYSNDPKAIMTAILWSLGLGAMFGFFGLLIAKACHKTGSATYRECWEATMGSSMGGWAVALVSSLLPAQGNLSYATVLSQTLKGLLETFGIHWSRITCLLFLTVIFLLPLCLMKDLDALAPFSALGVASVGVVMVSMMVRCFDGSYQVGGRFHDDIDPVFQPSFGSDLQAWTRKVLPYVCMLFQSYVMHYNVPRFFIELKDSTVPRFSQAAGYSFGSASCFNILVAGAGFLTFGGNSSSYILNNYSPADPLAFASRVGIFVSTLLIYPLAFIGVRDGLVDFFQVPQYMQSDRNMNIFSILVLTLLTIGAILLHDLGLINAIGGGALATFLCFVFPALMYRQAVVQAAHRDAYEIRESWLALLLMVMGVVLGIVGVYQSILEALRR